MDKEGRLKELMGGIEFKSIQGCFSGDEFMEIARYNEVQCDRLQSMGEHHRERIRDLLCLAVAEKFQPIATAKHGDSSSASLRNTLNETFNVQEMRSDLEKYKQLALEVLKSDGLNDIQLSKIDGFMSALPDMMISFLVELMSRLELVPMTLATRISSTLTRMITEGRYGDSQRNN